MFSALVWRQHAESSHQQGGETYLVLQQESLHVSVCFGVFVLDNELTPPVANLKKQENPVSS